MGSDRTTQVLSASASMPVGAMLLAVAVMCPESHLSVCLGSVQGSQLDLFSQIAILKKRLQTLLDTDKSAEWPIVIEIKMSMRILRDGFILFSFHYYCILSENWKPSNSLDQKMCED